MRACLGRWAILVVLSICLIDLARTMRCSVVNSRCLSKLGCGMAMKTYIVHCYHIMRDPKAVCNENCKHALVSLLSTDRKLRSKFWGCDCEGSEFCETSKRRIEACNWDVLKAMQTVDDDRSVLKCTLALWICRADTACLSALEHYDENCADLYGPTNLPVCNPTCNNSVVVLYRQQKAKKLKTCQCDQKDDLHYKQCVYIKETTDALCFRAQPKIQYQVQTANAQNSSQQIIAAHLLIQVMLFVHVFT